MRRMAGIQHYNPEQPEAELHIPKDSAAGKRRDVIGLIRSICVKVCYACMLTFTRCQLGLIRVWKSRNARLRNARRCSRRFNCPAVWPPHSSSSLMLQLDGGSTFSMLARAERLQTVRLLVLYQFEWLTGVYSSRKSSFINLHALNPIESVMMRSWLSNSQKQSGSKSRWS